MQTEGISAKRSGFSPCWTGKKTNPRLCCREDGQNKAGTSNSSRGYHSMICGDDLAHAPSLPNSRVHSEFLVRSSPLTVGREFLTALMKSLRTRGGSKSWSASTLSQLISTAPASPGEQGVSFSAPSTRTCDRTYELVSRLTRIG